MSCVDLNDTAEKRYCSYKRFSIAFPHYRLCRDARVEMEGVGAVPGQGVRATSQLGANLQRLQPVPAREPQAAPSLSQLIAENRQSQAEKLFPHPSSPPAEPRGSAELLSALSCPAKELRHRSLTSSPSFSWLRVRGVSSPCHPAGTAGAPSPSSRHRWAHGEGGWAGSRTGFVTPGQWSALLAVLPSLQATFQPRWRAPYGVLFPSPKHSTRFPACLTRCLCQAV